MRMTSDPKFRQAFLVVAMLAASTGVAVGQPVPRSRATVHPQITEVCWVETWGTPQCLSLDQLRRVLSKRDADRLLATLNQMLAGIGGDAAHDTLVQCGSTPRAVVAKIAPETEPPRGRSTVRAGDVQRLSGRISGCAGRVASFFRGRGPMSDGGRQWIDDTVAQVDAELAACRDSGDSRIAEDQSGVTTERKVKGVIDRSTPPPPTSTSDPSVDNSALLVKTKHGDSESKTPPATSSTTPSSSTKPSSPWKEPSPSGVRRGTTTPCPSGAECAPTCADKQAGWQHFKDTCEQSQWQAYPCVAFLRKVNGCVDASLINPGPDGDLTCPPRSRATPAERLRTAWELNCKRRQMFVTPVPGGGDVCKRPDEPLPARFDICSDPRAMPGQDQCTGPTGGPGPDRPAPTPRPDPRGSGGVPAPPR